MVHPMLQRYHPAARGSIYGLSGYVGHGGVVLAARASRKILQRPRQLGIGLCFEEAPVSPERLAGVAALCRQVGYRGVFEVEMVEVAGGALVIDFNPRFYSQMAFDVDRGLPLPRLAYADALGDEGALAALVAGAQRDEAGRVYCHRALFGLMLRAQRLAGHLGAEEERRWRRWYADHRAGATDAVADLRDPLPVGADAIATATWFARHPRSFLRSMTME